MFEPLTEDSMSFMKISARVLDAIRSCADYDAVDFDGGAGRRTRDGQSFGTRSRSEQRKRQQRERCK
jgi:hypothetical protein